MTIEATNPPGTALQTDSSDRVAFVVNGTPVTVRRDHPHLLAALREELDITSPKDGCSPSGQCGCCTVLVDGKAIVSCQQSVDKVANTNITTLEGVSQVERDAFANAFAACGGLQCGFCIPGIIVRAKAQIDKKGAALKREDMARHLGAHLCRCTGYVKILDAIDTVAKNLSPEIVSSGGLGVRVAKYEANELALGDRGYIDDMRITGLLHASLVFTKHARAEVLSIDTSKALSRPGVKAVFTAQDIPGELMMGIIYKDWPVMIPVGGFTSYAGDVLAIVVADSRLNARNAIDDVVVEYKPLTPITDARKAIASNDIAVWKTDSNVLSKSAYSRGDVDSAFASSAHVVRETFSTQRIEHAFLEPESTLAVPSLGDDQLRKLHVYSGGQGVWDDRNDIARLLAIPNDQVTDRKSVV